MNSPKPSFNIDTPLEQLHANERLKWHSRHLRGDIATGLRNPLTGAVPGEDPLLMKFHGIYQQDDRDLRASRQQRKLEPAYQFMVRLRLPGGTMTATQWLGLDRIARNFAERGLRITTRQTLQLHGVRKRQLKRCIKALAAIGLDTISACGDDNRGVVCGANPHVSEAHAQVQQDAVAASERFKPKTHGYREIWYDAPLNQPADEEPFYRELYMPRKFKIGFVLPPINDIDVYGQDLGFIAIVEDAHLVGYNVAVGGGMGKVDNREDSYPRLATVIGFVERAQALDLAEVIMGIQRDHGNRKDRHQARFKYTLDRLGMPWFRETLAERWGRPLAAARTFSFRHNGDEPGWVQGDDGLWHGTLMIQSGRVRHALQDRLAAFFQHYDGEIRLTTNQNLQLIKVPGYSLAQVKWRLDDLSLSDLLAPDTQAGFTLACVALPTCGLAMAEAERYLPAFLARFNAIKAAHQIEAQPITLRITGCPNGCARPYLAEVA
ncbi:MAG TPA: NADPH-dependent assimilatory sulfite reductase hemoprotein subunit, partial [Methylophilaceae bacterium]|nr:NADPH-dependent assimilatory sulfite reductase hemoprotein subunit [Methylophilaceae bacterium]